MSLAVTVAHDPLIDRDFAPVYYTQTDGQVMYYNAIQAVLMAHKFLALSEQDRARVDPLIRLQSEGRPRWGIRQEDGPFISRRLERLFPSGRVALSSSR